MANWRGPVSTPHPSSMTPLQLLSVASKQSSVPVGVHVIVSGTPSGASASRRITGSGAAAGLVLPAGRGARHPAKLRKTSSARARGTLLGGRRDDVGAARLGLFGGVGDGLADE